MLFMLDPVFCRLFISVAIALAAGGCATTTPLPAWNPAIASATTPAAVAVTAPVLQSVVAPFSMPYSAAVAARFPEPSQRYSTPGLAPARISASQATTADEVGNWLRDQAAAARQSAGLRAEVMEVGKTRQGQPLLALLLARSAGTLDAAASMKTNARPTVLLYSTQPLGVGGTMPGTEALLVVARELSQGLLLPLLERVNVVLLPLAGAGDVSPDESYDGLLLATPEAQALARLVRDFQPLVAADVREYAVTRRYQQVVGGWQKADAQVQYATFASQPEFLTRAAEEWLRKPLLAALNTQGLTSEWMHNLPANGSDKNAQKITMGSVQPGNARNALGLKNTVSLAIEARGGAELGKLHVQRRVHTLATALGSVLASTAQRAAELGQLRAFIDKESAAVACRGEATLMAAATAVQYELPVLETNTGADKTATVEWNSALALQTVKARPRPCGYWLSANSTQAVEKLLLHGVKVWRLGEAGSLLGDSYSKSTATAQGDGVNLQRSLLDTPRGSYWVPLAQPLAGLIMAALEPDTPWSFFSNRVLDSLQDTARILAEPTAGSLRLVLVSDL